jgi:hypothetical protein
MARWLSIFFGCTTALLAAVLGWLIAPQYFHTHSAEQPQPDEDIIFANKLFVNTEAFVYVAGTLTGDWIGYKNNTYSVLCVPQECMVAYAEQIGSRQVGRIDGPTVFPIVNWTADEVVASDNSLCAKITITIDRRTKTLLWVETPINQTTIGCKDADNAIRKATIEDWLFWQHSKSEKVK